MKSSENSNRSKKTTTITLAIVFTMSVSGFFMGLRQTVREIEIVEIESEILENDAHVELRDKEGGLVLRAVDYSAINQSGFGANSYWTNTMENLVQPQDSASFQVNNENPEVWRKLRAERRAYDGAPPVVPHPIDQDTAASCLLCHAKPTQIDNVITSAISHPVYTSCTQCHVSTQGLGASWKHSEIDLHMGNSYQGYNQPAKGERAYTDSPPTIPHTVHMRQNCMSCHGPLASSPIRTNHPERQSCVQCHVPSGGVNKANFAESPFPVIQELLKDDVE